MKCPPPSACGAVSFVTLHLLPSNSLSAAQRVDKIRRNKVKPGTFCRVQEEVLLPWQHLVGEADAEGERKHDGVGEEEQEDEQEDEADELVRALHANVTCTPSPSG